MKINEIQAHKPHLFKSVGDSMIGLPIAYKWYYIYKYVWEMKVKEAWGNALQRNTYILDE